VLGSALRQAAADGLIAANPVAAVKRPRVQRRELHWPTSAQLGALLEVSLETVWEVPILLAAVTGARLAEVLGISDRALDEEAREQLRELHEALIARPNPWTPPDRHGDDQPS